MRIAIPLFFFFRSLSFTTVSVKELVRYKDLIGVDCLGMGNGMSGRLVLMWDEKIDANLLSFSKHYIDVELVIIGEGNRWHFTGFYGWLG